jgi:hypothetical protein
MTPNSHSAIMAHYHNTQGDHPMKRLYATLAVLTLALSIGVTAMAQGKGTAKTAKKAGCSDCAKKCDVSPEQLRTFKRDTIDLRQELMNKRFDLQRENLKDAPDKAKVAALEAEIAGLKEKLVAKRTEAKLPASVCNDKDCPLMGGDCGMGKECGMSGKTGVCSKCADCKECRDCKDCKDCACKNCGKAGDCAKCNKKKQPAKAGCSKCNKK